MHTILENHFKSLEKQRTQLLSELKDSSTETLNQSRNNKWSINQVVGHLVAAEKLSVGYISKKINAINEVGNTGLWEELKLGVFIISQRLPFKYKAPKTLGENPPSYPDVTWMIKDWDESRLMLKDLLGKFPSDGMKKKIYRHPVMGRCSILHALIFFREHIIHHYPQIKRQL